MTSADAASIGRPETTARSPAVLALLALVAAACTSGAACPRPSADAVGLSVCVAQGPAAASPGQAPTLALDWDDAHAAGAVVPTAVCVIERNGPRIVTFGHTPTEVRRHELLEWPVQPGGLTGPPERLVGGEWHAFADPFVADLTRASYAWLGATGILVWDTAIPMALTAAAVRDGIVEALPVPSIPQPYPGLREGEWSATAMRPDICLGRDRVLLVAEQGRGHPARFASAPVAEPADWTLYTDLPGSRSGGAAPTVTVGGGDILVAYTSLTEGQMERSGGAPGSGSLLLCRSAGGETWSGPIPTVDEPKAHSSALAADDAVGLVMVYTAERDDGWPLFAARSADLGDTWGEPVMLSEPDVRCYRPDALLYGGSLYVAYLEVPKEPPPGHGRLALGDPTGVYTMVLDPNDLPVP